MSDMTERQAYFHKLQQTAHVANYLAGALSGCVGHPAREALGFHIAEWLYTLTKEIGLGLDSLNLPEGDA